MFVVPRNVLFGNKRSGTVSDVINYYKFELTISLRMSSNASEVVVLGHFFIEKLEMYAHSELENINVDPSRVIVHFKGVSGGTFRQFCSKELTECLKSPSFKYVICKIGGNDLDSTFRSETTVSTSIFCPMPSFCIMALTLNRSPLISCYFGVKPDLFYLRV